ncbi:MAG: biotin-dependent carboxyltransferase family protein [Eubacterium sp.]|nr:biotin-dependent carboxyltransferase family protein [Eubacterium sp.]
MAMHVIFPGPRTTIQDKGRVGYQNSGFAPSGFIDRVASRMANVLVNNQDSEAVIEFCLAGPILRFDEEVNIAVCGGDFTIDVEGKKYPANKAVHVPAGKMVTIVTGSVGTFGSIAVGGGLDIPEVMGSRSTNVRCGIGGFHGRALEAGDVIELRHPGFGRQNLSWRWVPDRHLVSPEDAELTKIRVIPGPQEDMFTEEGIKTFYESKYTISNQSDRMGFRLKGPVVEAINGYDILSDGIVNGSIQISGTGEPIVMMADRQTTGGYAKIASIINVDIPLFAQLRPGQKVRFTRRTVQEAQALMREADKAWREHCSQLKGPLFLPRDEEE